MSNLSQWFGFSVKTSAVDEIPNIYPLGILQNEFVEIDIINIYSKILTDAVERTSGLSDDQTALLWDNCLMSASSDGIITLLAWAMAEKAELFLVYDESLQLVREADATEKAAIKKEYETSAESRLGVYISFRNYTRTDMVRLYSGLEFNTVDALNKSINLSKAIQLKISDLRGTVSLTDSAEAKSQAGIMAKGLADGKDIYMDVKDEIVTSRPDLESVKASIAFIDSKRCFYLGMPSSYVNGQLTGGLGSTGEADTKGVERGLKSYYFSILKPVLETLFHVKLKYKSQDFRQISGALEALKTFELTSEEFLSNEVKKSIIEGMLDVDASDNETVGPEPVIAPPVPVLPPGNQRPPPDVQA